jgi:diaminopimelate decarboxylase
MSSNYNSRRFAPEILQNNGKLEVIRERQTFEQLMENEKIVSL